VLIPDEFQVNPAVLEAALREGGLDRGNLDLEGPQRRLTRFLAELGVPCLDLLPAFARVPATYAERDTHWNVRGNRLAAAEIASWVKSLRPNN
jgi:SGNH hydrolase-like domain, acetyltransferase AlgX